MATSCQKIRGSSFVPLCPALPESLDMKYALAAEPPTPRERQRARWILGAAAGLVALGSACSDDAPTVVVPGGAGGTSGGSAGSAEDPWTNPPELRDPVALDDAELGRQALALLGSNASGAEGRCSSCHALGRPTLTRWSQLTRQFSEACLEDPALSDRAAVDSMYTCFGDHAGSRTAFEPSDFGIYAAASHLPWFTFVFEHASGSAADWRAEHDDFVARVGMPRAGEFFSQTEFDTVAEWFARGVPGLFDLVPEDSGRGCTPGIAPELVAYVAGMESAGWRAKNAEVPLLNYGCRDGERGAECLSDLAEARDQPFGEAWDELPGTRIVMLRDNSDTPTTYWSRVSPDGRFIGSGLLDRAASGFSGQIVDLEEEAVISANFSYDATFFPDNSGFLVQRGGGTSSAAPGGGATSGGADQGDVAILCEQSVLADDPEEITGDEAQCTSLDSQIGLYQQLAKSVDGEDYWVVYGSYDGDDGGFRPVHGNPLAAFPGDSTTTLTPMINQGDGFEAEAPTEVSTPFQGDPMLSPSGRLLVTRVKGAERTIEVDGQQIVTADQSGYALHTVTTVQTGDGWSASLNDVGSICMTGGKAVFSYDERWMIFHHYVTDDDAIEMGFAGPDDPDFAEYQARGSSNLYLVDLLTSEARRITNMQPGQYAVYPHFRSDGWIYFVVRTLAGDEYFAASDAALVIETE
jgi:hypothetical protein